MIPRFAGKISDGRLRVYEKPKFTDYLKTLEGKEIEIIVQKWSDSRTLSQNRYYHGIVLPVLAEYIGELDNEEVCQDLRRKFLSYRKVVNGEERVYVKSTAELKVDEMNDYIDKVIMYASSELGVVIPDANEAMA